MKNLIIIFIALLPLQIAGGFEIGSGRRSAAGGAVLLSSPTAGDIIDYPGIRIVRSALILESGFERKFELADLDLIYAGAGYRVGKFSFGAGISQFGRQDYYTEKNYKGSLSYTFAHFSFGAAASGKSVEIGEGYGNFSAFSLAASGALRHDKVYFALTVDNINRPSLDDDAPKENIATTLLTEISGSSRVSLLGRALLEKSKKPQLSLAQYIRLIEENALLWNITGNPLTYGGGVELQYAGFSINYAASYHPTLGFSHNLSLAYSNHNERERTK